MNRYLKQQSGQHADRYNAAQLCSTAGLCCHKNKGPGACQSVCRRGGERREGCAGAQTQACQPCLQNGKARMGYCAWQLLPCTQPASPKRDSRRGAAHGAKAGRKILCGPSSLPPCADACPSSTRAYAHCRLCKQLQKGQIFTLAQILLSQFLETLTEECLKLS